MLARRLLLFAAILLLVTTISTALAPPPQPTDSDAPAVSEAPSAAEASETLARTVDASRDEPTTVRVETGDILELTVEADESATIQLEGLASIQTVSERTPAVFNVRPTRPGDYPVVLLDTEQRTVATVRVTPPER